MFAKAFLTFAALVIARSLWRFIQRFVVRTPLDNIPGLAPASFLTGSFSFRFSSTTSSFDYTGNFKQLFSVDGWAFHERLASQCKTSLDLLSLAQLTDLVQTVRSYG